MAAFRARSTRLHIMHSDPIVAIGLHACLAALPDHHVIITDAPSTEETADVVVCDEPRSRSVRTSLPHAAVIVLARRPKSFEIQSAMKRGVLGYVAENASPAEIVAAVIAGGQGLKYLCRLSAQEVATHLDNEPLTTREHAVLAALARGRCNKMIAKELDIATGTVKSHVTSILAKLNASSRTEAASIAMVRGFVQEPAFN